MSNNPLIAFLDRLGHKPTLFINKQERNTSCLGATITIIIGIGILVVFLYYFIDFALGVGMNIVSSKEDLTEGISFDLNQKLFMIHLIDSTGNRVSNSVVHLHATFWNYKQLQTTIKNISLETCTYEKHFPQFKYENLASQVNISEYLCLEQNIDAKLGSDVISGTGSYISIYISKCDNNTMGTNGEACLSQDEIDKTLRQKTLYFTYYIENIKINHFNSSNPFSITSFFKYIKITPEIAYDYTTYYRYVKYNSDQGWLLNIWNKYTGYQIDESLTEKFIHTTNPEYPIANSLGSFCFWVSPKSINTYERTYPKIQTAIANISALMKVFIIIGEIIVSLFATGNYYISLVKSTQRIIIPFKLPHTICLDANKIQQKTVLTMDKQQKPNPCVSCLWMLFPKFNKLTDDIELCKMKIADYLSVENLIMRLTVFERQANSPNKRHESGNNTSTSVINSQYTPINLMPVSVTMPLQFCHVSATMPPNKCTMTILPKT